MGESLTTHDLAYRTPRPVTSPLIDHPLTPLIDAYKFAAANRCAFASPENREEERRATEALNQALREMK